MLLRSWIRWKRPGCACDRFDHVGTEIGALSIAIESRRSCWFRFRVVICARDSVPRTNAPRCSRAMAVPGTPRAWGSSARRAERSESRHAKLETAPNRSLRGRAPARVPSTTLKGSAGRWGAGPRRGALRSALRARSVPDSLDVIRAVERDALRHAAGACPPASVRARARHAGCSALRCNHLEVEPCH